MQERTQDRRAERRARTADEIVAAAEAIVVAHGPLALTAKALAEAIGMTPGALYKHFPSLDAVLARVQARVIADLGAAVSAAVTSGSAPPSGSSLVAVAAGSLALVRFARAEPRRYGLLARMFATPEPLVGDAAAADVLPIAMAGALSLRKALTDARHAGLVGEGADDERLLALWATVHGATQVSKVARFVPAANADRVAVTAITALLVGWGAAPEVAAAAVVRASLLTLESP